ncbi:MAG: SRPBCC family protein [Nitrospira sp.]|nr:SRPBCC family protein [Nitrospira sp.]
MLNIIIAVMILLVATLLIYAATKPDTFRLQRSTIINAPPEKIFPFLSDFQHWLVWSPWEKLDPELKRSFSGASQGKGAQYQWEGNSKVGTGGMEIMEAAPSKIRLKLDFLKPFEAHNFAEFTLEPRGGVTNVTWAMYGAQPFMAKVMSLFMNCEKVVEPQFETGLANLKTIAEQ